jgi:hypothetical protein
MESVERTHPILLGGLGLVLLVVIVLMVRATADGWDMWRGGIREMVWILAGFTTMLGSLAWMLVVILLRQFHPRFPSAREGCISLQAPMSVRRALLVGMLGLVLVGVGSVGVVAHGVSTAEVPMTSYRWFLVAALILVLLTLSLIFVGGWRLVRIRFVADREGLAWDRVLSSTRIEMPWAHIERIELRGRWLLTTRSVVITDDGRTFHPLAWDPSIPMSRAAAERVVAEIEAMRPSIPDARSSPFEPHR